MSFLRTVLIPLLFSSALAHAAADIDNVRYDFEKGEVVADIRYHGLEGQEFKVVTSREEGYRIARIEPKVKKPLAKQSSKNKKNGKSEKPQIVAYEFRSIEKLRIPFHDDGAAVYFEIYGKEVPELVIPDRDARY